MASAGLLSCAEGEPAESSEGVKTLATQADAASTEKPRGTTLTDVPPSLRAATIAAVQAGASIDYDLQEAWDEAGALEGALPAMGLAVRASTRGVELGPLGEPAHLGLHLAAAGCVGQARAAHAATPNAERNRAVYEHELEGGREVEAWYVSGPLGVEQGFTLEADWGCATTELVVSVEGAAVETAKDGLVLASSRSGARYGYTDLFAHDAQGKELPARMSRGETGAIVLVVETAGAVFPIVVDPLVAVQQAKLVASDAAMTDQFGWAVAVSGDTALVAAKLDDSFAGSAYIFQRSGGAWTQQAKLEADDGAADDLFGWSVDLSGDTAVVGAMRDSHSGFQDVGSAYVFQRTGNAWTQQAKLVASDAADDDAFGWSIAVSGDTAMVGAPADEHATGGGSVYVFERSGGSWTEQSKLVASDAAVEDGFGRSVAMTADTAVVGSMADDHSGIADAGSAYVFTKNGTVWTEQAKLVADDAAATDFFGAAVAVSGDSALVGAYFEDNANGNKAGSAYVFVRAGATWTQQAKLMASDGAQLDSFGLSVGLSGDVAVVGAYLADQTGAQGSNEGKAYLFQRSGNTWTEEATLVASDAAEGDQFGQSVAINADAVVVGAHMSDSAAGTDAGSAYVFLLEGILELGEPCSGNSACDSGFCSDGVCCDTACGGSDTQDCRVCSVAAGAQNDGTCTPVAAATSCSDDDACTTQGACDGSGTCVGSAPLTCEEDGNECTSDVCDSESGCGSWETDGTPCTDGVCLDGACDTSGEGTGGGGAGGAGGESGNTGGGGGDSGGGGGDSDGAGCSCRSAGAPAGVAHQLAWLTAALLGALRMRRTHRA